MKCTNFDVWKRVEIEAGFIEKELGFQWIKEENEILKMLKGYKMYLQKRGQDA